MTIMKRLVVSLGTLSTISLIILAWMTWCNSEFSDDPKGSATHLSWSVQTTLALSNPPVDEEESTDSHDPAVGGLPDADEQTTGRIVGQVAFKGELPALEPHTVREDHEHRAYCGEKIINEKLIVNDKMEVANAVVSLANVKGVPKPAPRDLELTNDKCRFVPHVLATTTGSKLLITSKDKDILHNSHGYLGNEFNVAVTSRVKLPPRRLRKSGWTLIKCDIHSWMQAHLWVFDHPFFAVSSKSGKFRLEGVPPGDYELEIWHERLALKPIKQRITVAAQKTTETTVELKLP